jgi:hypothetical protein
MSGGAFLVTAIRLMCRIVPMQFLVVNLINLTRHQYSQACEGNTIRGQRTPYWNIEVVTHTGYKNTSHTLINLIYEVMNRNIYH